MIRLKLPQDVIFAGRKKIHFAGNFCAWSLTKSFTGTDFRESRFFCWWLTASRCRWAWSSMWGDGNNKWRCCQPLTFNSTWKAAKRTLHRTKRTKKLLGHSFQYRLKKGNKLMQNRGSKKSNRRRKDSLEILALRLVFCVWKSYINGPKRSLTQLTAKKRNH